MTDIIESTSIAGVKLAHLRAFQDSRGQFMELFRKDWFPDRSWEIIQSNRSDSAAGVLRGLHYHHHQVDYWHVVRGELRVGLADLRPSSQTYGAVQIIDLGQNEPAGLFIPIGVAHGFYATSEATLTYIVDNYYDGDDELGVAWDDPTLNVPWDVSNPTLSDRDLENPQLSDIPSHLLPK